MNKKTLKNYWSNEEKLKSVKINQTLSPPLINKNILYNIYNIFYILLK